MLHLGRLGEIRDLSLIPNVMIWQQVADNISCRFLAIYIGKGTAQYNRFIIDRDRDVKLADAGIMGQSIANVFNQIRVEV